MRQETRERISDLVYSEAMHDRIVDEVVALEVEEIDKYGENGPVTVSPALAYLLMDELRLGADAKGLTEVVNLRVTWHKPRDHDDGEAILWALQEHKAVAE